MTYFLNPAYLRLDCHSSKKQPNTSGSGNGVFEESMDQNVQHIVTRGLSSNPGSKWCSFTGLLWERLINLPNPWGCFTISQD